MNTEAIMPQTSDLKKNLNINIDLRGWPCTIAILGISTAYVLTHTNSISLFKKS